MTVSKNDLRLPADALILYCLYCCGQGTSISIADMISRNERDVSQRISKLSELGLVTGVDSPTEPVTLSTPDGVDAAEKFVAYLFPDQRHKIEQMMAYSVTWN
ncbi:helix-turn-helix domain-containing protein [Natronorubrum aibiense]|uniref:MarR family transcriptional regulator n=1 Tax=Natronorubrum aibiense TaxID=348826 RepID=A0A5P9P2I1_9EURY|nr:hypothetical protein [Natronorubrum aibiense]QFU82339.1 hypothetical protein GCU68_07285 [Natronorubrum aibiense]